ncbi:exodeoxyribonuclease VII small subunit [Pelagibacterium mangrovi]|uniref:exodeoxyribonuclease VII small subunit n=1 Tax=Pelagibacterium mangrovi TaxID=3119828 RepID=UPI003F816429
MTNTERAAMTDIADLSFEAALDELEKIVAQLEGGKAPLQESIAIYERGEALKRHCEALLKQAEARIEKITLARDGTPTGVEPLDQ